MEKHELEVVSVDGQEMTVSVKHFVENQPAFKPLTEDADKAKVEAFKKDNPHVKPQANMEKAVADSKLADLHEEAVKEAKKAPAPKADKK